MRLLRDFAPRNDKIEVPHNDGCQQPFSLKLELPNRRYLGVEVFGTSQDIAGLHEQNRILVIDTIVLFYT